MKKPKCGCRKCIAMKMYRDRNHPYWEMMFWQSISSNGKFERSHRWQDRNRNNVEDITQKKVGYNNRKYMKYFSR